MHLLNKNYLGLRSGLTLTLSVTVFNYILKPNFFYLFMSLFFLKIGEWFYYSIVFFAIVKVNSFLPKFWTGFATVGGYGISA